MGKGESGTCARCHGQMIQCSMKYCLGKCGAHPKSVACRSCVRSSCGSCHSQKSAEAMDFSFIEALVNVAKNNSTTKAVQQESVDARSGGCYESESLMKSCAGRCLASSDRPTCAANCLLAKGESGRCARCHGNLIHCTMNNCLNKCVANPKGAACGSCVQRSCGSCNSQKSAEAQDFSFVEVTKMNASPVPVESADVLGGDCFEAVMQTCKEQCATSNNQIAMAACSTLCLLGKAQTNTCAQCHGQQIQCVVENCLGKCLLHPKGETCSSCMKGSCRSCNTGSGQAGLSFVQALADASGTNTAQALQEKSLDVRNGDCFETVMQTCKEQCATSSNQIAMAACSTLCLLGSSQTMSCTQCHGQQIQCTVTHCLGKCISDPKGAACSTCVESSCGSCNSQGQAMGVSFVQAVADASNANAAHVQQESVDARSGGCYESESLMKSCAGRCLASSDRPTCAANCLLAKGESGRCARCHGNLIHCTMNNCLNKCVANPKGAACGSCVQRSCGSCNSQKSAEAQDFSFVEVTKMNASPVPVESADVLGGDCFEAVMQTCKEQCATSNNQIAMAACSTLCLLGKAQTNTCAQCHGQQIQCVVENCLGKCLLHPKGETCSSCMKDSCPSCNTGSGQAGLSFVQALADASSTKSAQALQEKSLDVRNGDCFETVMQTCKEQCATSSNQIAMAACSTLCLLGSSQTMSCTQCHGQQIQCTVTHCLGKCISDPKGAACSTCVESSCGSCNSQGQAMGVSFVQAVADASNANAAHVQQKSLDARSGGCYESESLMKSCAGRCLANSDRPTCAANCLLAKGESGRCARCHGNLIHCTMNNCLNKCVANPKGAACGSCVQRSCGSCNSQKSAEAMDFSFIAALVNVAKNNSTTKAVQQESVDARSGGCYESESLMKSCAGRCLASSDRPTCAANCLLAKGESGRCARCHGNLIHCTMNNCLNKCVANPKGAACGSCVQRSCGSCNSQKSAEAHDFSFVEALPGHEEAEFSDPVYFP